MRLPARFARLCVLSALVLGSPGAIAEGRQTSSKPLFRDFMGLNTHTVQFKPDLYKPVTRLLRDYHGFKWDVGDETDFPTKFPFARNRVDWGSMYASWNKAGYRIDVSVMFDDTRPAAWRDLKRDGGEYGYQFAHFFGPSAKNLVEAAEIGNEPGNYDDATYRTLFESVAQGMRRGDPKLLISTCAVYARPSGPYHKNIAILKGLESLYDVVNVHSYAEAEGYPTWRRSFPEDPKLEFLPKIQEVISWRNQHAAGKPIWLTEFGWDSTTKPQATLGTFKQWVGVSDLQQAQYLVRAFLQFSTLDLDRAYIFWFNDEDVASVHASSGLTRNFQPKPSFHAVAHLFATLGEYRFERVVAKKPGEIFVIEFRHGTQPDLAIWAAWSPTGSGRNATTRLRIPGNTPKRAERMSVSSGAPEATKWTTSEPGEIELAISESPVYLWFVR
jgi:hypothetical protein